MPSRRRRRTVVFSAASLLALTLPAAVGAPRASAATITRPIVAAPPPRTRARPTGGFFARRAGYAMLRALRARHQQVTWIGEVTYDAKSRTWSAPVSVRSQGEAFSRTAVMPAQFRWFGWRPMTWRMLLVGEQTRALPPRAIESIRRGDETSRRRNIALLEGVDQLLQRRHNELWQVPPPVRDLLFDAVASQLSPPPGLELLVYRTEHQISVMQRAGTQIRAGLHIGRETMTGSAAVGDATRLTVDHVGSDLSLTLTSALGSSHHRWLLTVDRHDRPDATLFPPGGSGSGSGSELARVLAPALAAGHTRVLLLRSDGGLWEARKDAQR